MRIRRVPILLVLLAVVVVLAGVAVTAQNTLATCPDIVSAALEAVSALCTGQARNSACYGNTLVSATFVDDTPDMFFQNEGDVINLNLLRTIETSPFDDPENAWGVSLLSVQANLPGALPGQNAQFLLIGGAQIENAVTPDTAFASARPIPAAAIMSASLFAQPNLNAEVVVSAAPGEPLLADARSADGAFVRVTAGESFGWIARDALPADPALDALPPYTPGESVGPMQAFFLRSGIGQPQCAQAPSALLVQGPENLTVQINANGADIALGSTIILRTLSEYDAKAQGLTKQTDQNVSGALEVSVIDGEAVVQNGDGEEIVIEEGEWSAICLTEPEDLGVDGQANDQEVTDACGGWTDPAPISQVFRDQFALVDDFPLNYPVEIFTPTPTATLTPLPPAFTPVPSQTLLPMATANPPTPVPPTAPPTGADLHFTVSAALEIFAGQLSQLPGAGFGASETGLLNVSVNVVNQGPLTTTVSVSNLLPPASSSGGEATLGSYDPETDTWLLGVMAPGSSGALSLSATLLGVCGDVITQSFTVSSTQPDPNGMIAGYTVAWPCPATDTPTPTETSTPADTPTSTGTPIAAPTETPTDAFTATSPPTITLTSTNTPTGLGADIGITGTSQTATSILEGEEVCFSIFLLNNGPDDAIQAQVSDLLATGLTFTSRVVSQGGYNFPFSVWTLGSFVSGDTASITVCGTADVGTAGQTLSTTALLTALDDNSSGNDSAVLSVDVLGS